MDPIADFIITVSILSGILSIIVLITFFVMAYRLKIIMKILHYNLPRSADDIMHIKNTLDKE